MPQISRLAHIRGKTAYIHDWLRVPRIITDKIDLGAGIDLADNVITFNGTSGTNMIRIPDNLANALSIQEGSNIYMTFDTTDLFETVEVLKDTTVAGNLDATGIVTASQFTVDEIDINDSTIEFSGTTGTNIFSIPDNFADALSIQEGLNKYLSVVTSNGTESIELFKNTNLTGNFDVTGNMDASGTVTTNQVSVDDIDIIDSSITFTSTTTETNRIIMVDDVVDALSIANGGDEFMTFVTSNGTESVQILKNTNVVGTLTVNGLPIVPGTSDGIFAPGTAADPGLAFMNGTTTGMSAEVADTLVFSTDGEDRLTLSPNGNATLSNQLTVPTIIFSGTESSLMFNSTEGANLIQIPQNSTDAMSITAGSTDLIIFDTTMGTEAISMNADVTIEGILTVVNQLFLGTSATLVFPNASAAAPSVTFRNDTTTGISAATTGTLVLSTLGEARLTLNTTADATFTVPTSIPQLILPDNDTNSSATVSIQAPSLLTDTYTLTLPTHTSTKDFVLKASDTNGTLIWGVAGSGSGTTYLNASLGLTSITSSSYTLAGALIYPGSTAVGAITGATVASFLEAGTSYDIRLFDFTNSAVIAEITDQTNPVTSLFDMGSISNVPTGQALIEIQAQVIGGGKTVVLESFQIEI